MQDLLYSRNCVEALTAFHDRLHERMVASKQPLGPSDFDGQSEREACSRVERMLSDLIKFVSLSNNMCVRGYRSIDLQAYCGPSPLCQSVHRVCTSLARWMDRAMLLRRDPMTREGLPRPDQQSLLCELLLLERLLDIVNLLIPPLTRLRESNGAQGVERMLTRLAKLCQRLMRLVLRRNADTCKYAANKKDRNGQSAFVVPLGKQMGYGILAAETLREIYVDNEALLDEVHFTPAMAPLHRHMAAR